VVVAAARAPAESVGGFVEDFDMEPHEELFLAEVIMSNGDKAVT